MVPGAIGVLNKVGVELAYNPERGPRPVFPIRNIPPKECASPPATRSSGPPKCCSRCAVPAPIRKPERRTSPACGAARPTVIGFGEALTAIECARALAAHGVTFLSMELMPRITRAQSMDALSSMATIAGYKAVLLAADALPRMFPMMMTAAGTITPARVFDHRRRCRRSAGHRHRAAARRRGQRLRRPARREGTDREPGAKFVVLDVRQPARKDKGGYAKATGRRVLSQAARADAAACIARAGRRHHHRGRPGQEGAYPDHAGNGPRAWRRIGHRRYRGRARRQLRAHPPRRNRRRSNGVTIWAR